MLKNLLNLLFPKLCAGCNGLLLQHEATICISCRHDLPFTQHHHLQHNYTTKKFYGIIPVEFCASMLYFHKDGIVQNLIHNLKYKNHQEIGTLLGNWCAEDLKDIQKKYGFTDIIPVPLHKKRFEERGYNQVHTFCETLAKNLEINYNSTLLIRNFYSKTQTKKNKEQRSKGTASLFDVKYTPADCGKHILLIDDVITSGATLQACAKALLKIPNVKISIYTIAYTDS